MARYDYQCQNCKQIFEIVKSIHDTSIPECMHCGNKKTKKCLSLPAISFRGSGFYRTDNVKSVFQKAKIETPKVEKIEKVEKKEIKKT
jgi:putative FmdB family regulatory protein